MTTKTKAIIVTVTVLIISILIVIIKYQYDLLQKQKGIADSVVEMKQLQNGWVRDSARYATKDDLKAFAKSNDVDLGPVKDDLKKLDADITGISRILSKTPGYNGTNLSSTSTNPGGVKPPEVKCPDGNVIECPDKYGHLKNTQVLELNEPFNKTKIPFGQVKFSSWREKPWDLQIKPREYSVVTVLSTDPDGRHYVHNKFQVGVDNKKYNVPIEKADFIEVYPENEFRFNPQLMLGLGGGMHLDSPLRGEVDPNISLSLFSYGKTKINPTFMFLLLGAGYEINDQYFNFMLSPVMYNIGEPIPLVRNLYLGSSLSVDFKGSFGVFGNIGVNL